jgi:hypothetical protein
MQAANRVISYFELGEHNIRVEKSKESGREWVYVNEQLVSEKLSWRFKTVHSFTVQGQAVEVMVQLSGRFRGSLEIELWVDGVLKDSDEWDFRRKSWSPMTAILFIFLSGIGWAFLGFKLATWLYGA